MKRIYGSIIEAIGNTPLVKLQRIVPRKDVEVWVKCEHLNPSGSVKDRMAYYIIEKAEREGKLKPGGVIVENTSGNTGAAVAMIGAAKGYRCIFTIPDKMSQEKIDQLKAYGAKVHVTPTDVPPDSPESYYSVARRLAQEIPGAFYVNQYFNPDNIEAHYRLTAPELWKQLDGRLDIFVGGIGTGGTVSGIGRFLKEKDPSIQVIGVDPVGSVYYDYFKHKKLITPKVYQLEGIGEDMLVDCMDFSVLDDIIQVTDKQGFVTGRKLAREEGIYAGGSSGAAVWAALELAKKAEKGTRIVTLLPDHGNRYLSKMYSDEWMIKHYGSLEEPS